MYFVELNYISSSIIYAILFVYAYVGYYLFQVKRTKQNYVTFIGFPRLKT